jgi:hypothetical protein
MCSAESGFDTMLGVFGDHTDSPRCPSTGADNYDLLWCNDDYCTSTLAESGISWFAVEGASYVLRFGGYSAAGTAADASMGWSSLHIGFFCDPWPYPLTLPENPRHRIRKHRYLSIDATANMPDAVAIKVEVAEMWRCSGDPRRSCLTDNDCKNACDNNFDKTCTSDAQCSGGNCVSMGTCVDMAPSNPPLSWFVQEPYQESQGCLPTCGPEDWIAKLGPTAFVADWTAYGDLIHIGDCPIVPCTTYNVYACDPLDISWCSEPLVIATQVMPFATPRNYGDVAGPTDVGLNITEPDGFVSVVDVFAWVLTKQNYGTAALPQAHPTRMDLHGLGDGIPPDYFLTVSDLSAIYIFGFQRGLPWANSQGGLEPHNCP